MAEPFIGQIILVGFNFEPVNWAFCNGQLLSISQNAALFSLVGTFYGGNGTTNFALPDLRSRVPLHFGQGNGLSPYAIGESAGVENVSLLSSQIPAHTHALNATASYGAAQSPAGAFLAETSQDGSSRGSIYFGYSAAQTTPATLNPNSVGLTGGNLPHPNIQPVLALNYIISLAGIFPSRG